MRFRILLFIVWLLAAHTWAFDNFNSAYEAADKDIKARQHAAAVEKLHEAAELARNDEEKAKAFYRAGLAWHWGGKPEKAIEEFNKVLAMQGAPSGLRTLSLRLAGMNYMRLHKDEKAEILFKEFLTRPDAPPAFKDGVKQSLQEIGDRKLRLSEGNWKDRIFMGLLNYNAKSVTIQKVLAMDRDRIAEIVVDLIGKTDPEINVYNADRIGFIYGRKRPDARNNAFGSFCPCVDGYSLGMEILRKAPEELRKTVLLPALRNFYDRTRNVDSKLNAHMALSAFDPALAAQTTIDNCDITSPPQSLLDRDRASALQPDHPRGYTEWYYKIAPPSDSSDTATMLAEAMGRNENGFARYLGMVMDTLCDAEGVPALLKLFEDKDWYPRWAATAALEIMGSKAKDALPALEKRLDDESEDIEVRVGAARAIACITGRNPFDLYSRIPDYRDAIVRSTYEKADAWKSHYMQKEGARFVSTRDYPFSGKDGRAIYALATNQHLEEANQYLLEVCENYKEYSAKGRWPIDAMVEALVLFHDKSRFYPGRLTPEAERAIKTYVYNLSNGATDLPERYIVTKAEAEDALAKRAADPSLVLTRNDNGYLTPHAFIYFACSVLKEDPEYKNRKFASGETVTERYEALNRWFKQAFRDWALSGLTPELGSTGYEVTTWGILFRLADLSPDPELRKVAQMYLDVAVMEVEQISMNSVRSGYKSRPKTCWLGSRLRPLRAMLFGERGGSPIYPSLTFSSYKPPEAAILLRKLGPPVPRYEIRNHYLGYQSDTTTSKDMAFWLKNPPCFGYAYRTPEYILGSIQYDSNRPLFAGMASHWMGVFFHNLQSVSLPGYHGGMMAVQDKDALILQRISGTLWPGRPVVELTRGLEWTERDGWVFVNNGTAFAAIRILMGGYVWNPEPTALKQFWPNDPFASIIIQAGTAEDYASFEQFQERVLAAKLELDYVPGATGSNQEIQNKVIYAGLNCRELTLFSDRDHFQCNRHYTKKTQVKLARIDGHPLDLQLRQTFSSPFLNQRAGEETSVLRFGQRQWIYDFENLKVSPLLQIGERK